MPSTVASSVASGRHDENVLRADDHAREHVAPEAVGAEPVVPGGGGEIVEGIGRERVVGRDQVAEDRADHPEAEDHRRRR